MTLKLNYKSIDEVPEDMRQYCTTQGEGDEQHIVYNNDALLGALKKERNTTAESHKKLSELEAQLKALQAKPADKEKPADDNKVDPLIAEMKKQIAQLQQTNEQTAAQAAEQLKLNAIQQAATKAGLRPEAVKLIESEIDQDERGLFVKDVDGTPKLNASGNRMTPDEYLQAKRKTDGWLFNNQASSPQTYGTKPQAQEGVMRKLQEQAAEALKNGDVKTQIELIRKAQGLKG